MKKKLKLEYSIPVGCRWSKKNTSTWGGVPCLTIKGLVGWDNFTSEEICYELYDLAKMVHRHKLDEIKGIFRVQRVPLSETKGRVHVSTFRIKGTHGKKIEITFNYPMNRITNHITGETKEIYKEKK